MHHGKVAAGVGVRHGASLDEERHEDVCLIVQRSMNFLPRVESLRATMPTPVTMLSLATQICRFCRALALALPQ